MDDIEDVSDYTSTTYQPLEALADPQYTAKQEAKLLNSQQTLNLQNPGQNPVVMNRTALARLPISDKAQIFRDYNTRIPNNDLGLPEFIYRADIIPSNLYDYSPQEQHDLIDQSVLELDYSQGYPSLPDGSPFWAQLPSESPEQYKLFITYLDLPTTKIDTMRTPVRVLQLMAVNIGKPTEDLLSSSHIYYWVQRAQAYDLFQVARHNKMKEQRLMRLEDDHFNKAENYLSILEPLLERMLLEPEKYELTAKEAMDMFMKLVGLQRLSVGANPNGQHQRKDQNELPQNAPLEVILRTITKNAGMGAKTIDDADLTKQLLANPELLEQAQEMIIRLNPNKSAKFGNMAESNLHME